jgi:RNA polymerase sigma factor (sigma-70 family)
MEAGTGIEPWNGLSELEPALRSFLGWRCRDASELDDVVQETLLRAARYRSSLIDPDRLCGWALRIASNVLRDAARREGRMQCVDPCGELLDGLEGREGEPGAYGELVQLPLAGVVMEKHEALGMLSASVHELGGSDRKLLESYYTASPCGERTARECGVPRELVKVRLFRARRRLRRIVPVAAREPEAGLANRRKCAWAASDGAWPRCTHGKPDGRSLCAGVCR